MLEPAFARMIYANLGLFGKDLGPRVGSDRVGTYLTRGYAGHVAHHHRWLMFSAFAWHDVLTNKNKLRKNIWGDLLIYKRDFVLRIMD